MLNELIGYQIISLNKDGFAVRKGNEIKHFAFFEDYGDCCGFNELRTALMIDPNDSANNPFISRVEYAPNTRFEYFDSDSLVITFFGADKILASIESMSSSGSGWCYGACVKVVCVETDEEELLTKW